jgi:hypothetical protein
MRGSNDASTIPLPNIESSRLPPIFDPPFERDVVSVAEYGAAAPSE